MSKDVYNKLLAEVEEAKVAQKKTSVHYRRLNRFGVLEVFESKKLVTIIESVKYYLPAEEIYYVIEAAHIAAGHGGREKIRKEIGRKYAIITREMVKLFLSMCEACHLKKSKKRKGVVSKSILHNEMNS